MLVFDSDAFPEDERAEALSAAISGMETPQRVTFNAKDRIRHRVEIFELGTGAHLMRNTGTPIHVLRSDSHVRQGTREEAAFYIQTRGESILTTGRGMSAWQSGQLGAVDITRPYAVRQIGDCENTVLLIEFSRLGLPVDQIRSAVPLIGKSPLYRLVREHLLRLDLDLSAEAAAMTGQATADLVAALLATVSDHRQASEILNATESTRIAAYVAEHLGEADLSTEQIASVHGISARQFTAQWHREHGATPAEWIAGRRMERARRLLADPALARANMEDIAYACGFSDRLDFDRNFQAAYGLSPGEFRLPMERVGGDPNPWGGRDAGS